MLAEQQRLLEAEARTAHWRRWGPYLSERQWLLAEGTPELLFVENETNVARLFGAVGPTRFPKDGINEYVVEERAAAVNPAREGTKAAAHYHLTLSPVSPPPSGFG